MDNIRFYCIYICSHLQYSIIVTFVFVYYKKAKLVGYKWNKVRGKDVEMIAKKEKKGTNE